MTTASPVTIVGATGLTGSASLKQLLASKTAFDITTIARKAINTPTAANPSTQYSHVLVDDLFEVPKSDQIIAKAGSTYVSALGTTRGSAGSFEAQEKIDVTLNVDMAKRAKEQGAERMVFVSSIGDPNSMFPYLKMKGQVNQALKEMGFKSLVILQPGVLLGPRDELRSMELVGQWGSRFVRAIGFGSRICVDGDDVGACVAHFVANPPSEAYVAVGNKEIIDIAQKWREANGISK